MELLDGEKKKLSNSDDVDDDDDNRINITNIVYLWDLTKCKTSKLSKYENLSIQQSQQNSTRNNSKTRIEKENYVHYNCESERERESL